MWHKIFSYVDLHCLVLLSFLYRTKSQNTRQSGYIPDIWQPCFYLFIKEHYLTRGHPFMTSTQRGRGQARVDIMCMGKGGQLHVDIHKKLEPTDVILSSSRAMKLALFVPGFRLRTQSKVEIFHQYKLIV